MYFAVMEKMVATTEPNKRFMRSGRQACATRASAKRPDRNQHGTPECAGPKQKTIGPS
jgi:hypothetical protein